MSIRDLIQSAKPVDMFSDLDSKSKKISVLKGKVSVAIINKRYRLSILKKLFSEKH